MSEKSGFFNAQKTSEDSYDRTYNAEDFAKIFRQMISNGIYVTDKEFEQGVINKNTVSGLKPIRRGNYIDISPGRAMINGYWYENDETLTLQFPNLGGRILIVLQLNVSNREVKIISKTWDGGDIVLTQDEGVYEIAIATATYATPTTFTLTDRREEFVTLSLKSIQELVTNLRDEILYDTVVTWAHGYDTQAEITVKEGYESINIPYGVALTEGNYMLHFEFSYVAVSELNDNSIGGTTIPAVRFVKNGVDYSVIHGPTTIYVNSNAPMVMSFDFMFSLGQEDIKKIDDIMVSINTDVIKAFRGYNDEGKNDTNKTSTDINYIITKYYS